MDLDALATFNRVAAHGGFGPASRATGQPKATLSRHVRDLEDSLGVRLIERGPRTFRLTTEGEALHARTGVLLVELNEALRIVAGGVEIWALHTSRRLVSPKVAALAQFLSDVFSTKTLRRPD